MAVLDFESLLKRRSHQTRNSGQHAPLCVPGSDWLNRAVPIEGTQSNDRR